MGKQNGSGTARPQLSSVICDVYIRPGVSADELVRMSAALPEIFKKIASDRRKGPVFYVRREGLEKWTVTPSRHSVERVSRESQSGGPVEDST